MPFSYTTQTRSALVGVPGGARMVSGQFRIRTLSEVVPGSTFTMSPEFFKALEDMIAYCESVPKKLPWAMDKLAKYMAYTNLAIAQQMSAGVKKAPRDTTRSWMIPVPRITWRYFLSWHVKRLRMGTWVLWNDSREAYFIEYGIQRNPQTGQVSPRRMRRPIQKLSLLRTMKAIQSTAVAHRVWSDVFWPKPGEPGRRTRSILWTMQSPHTQAAMGIQGTYMAGGNTMGGMESS